jgi:tetratricopeptide (TPR) repeat protein
VVDRAMIDDELEQVRALRADGETAAYLEAALELARRRPGDVDVRIEAAYACDRYGTEEEAVGHYDAAWRMGVPDDRRREFSIGYGSTLRNVGRSEEAVAILGEAVERYPDDPALEAFLALALFSEGHAAAALATMLDAVLALDRRAPALGGYERALGHYRDELLEAAVEAR